MIASYLPSPRVFAQWWGPIPVRTAAAIAADRAPSRGWAHYLESAAIREQTREEN